MSPAPVGGIGGMDAVGSMLANAPPQNAAGAGPDARNQQLEATMGTIRDLGEQVKQLAAANPMIADEAQQIQQLLKQMVVKAAQPAPVQTGSSLAVPGGATA